MFWPGQNKERRTAMRVKIGNYPITIGTHNIYKAYISLRFKKYTWEVSDKDYSWPDRFVLGALDVIDDWISPLNRFVGMDRKVKVRVSSQDIYSVDSTLALVILPVLEKFRSNASFSSPNIDPDDVKDKPDNSALTDWEYVLDKMILSFSSKTCEWEEDFYSDEFLHSEGLFDGLKSELDSDGKKFYYLSSLNKHIDYDGMNKKQIEITQGFLLFGKYYESLWT